jgi:uncharacterized membrane protein YidH (DUF202 family)
MLTFSSSRSPGNSFNVASGVCAAGIALLLMAYVRWENNKRAAGHRDSRLDGLSEQEIRELGHRHPTYRLMT